MERGGSQKAEFMERVMSFYDPVVARVGDADWEALARAGSAPGGSLADPAPAFCEGPLDACAFSLALNSINHRFWELRGGALARYARGGLEGALAMRAGLESLLSELGGIPKSGAARVGVELARRHFGDMPSLGGRAEALGQALGPAGRQAALEMEQARSRSEPWSLGLAARVADLLPLGFKDPFLKKAQLSLWMARSMVEAMGEPAPEADLTAFADYQIPKVLRSMGALSYAGGLAGKVDAGVPLEPGGSEESAIRAATIIACERGARACGVSSPELDAMLWSRRGLSTGRFHLCETDMY